MAENTVKRDKKKKKKGLLFLGYLLICFILGLLLAVFDVDMSFLSAYSLADYVAIFILFYIGVFLSVNLHELGHLLVGKLLGYKFLMFRAGVFSFQKENGKIRFSIIKNVGYGGLCAMMPEEDSSLRDFAIYSLGGIFMNLLTGIGFILISFQMKEYSVVRMAIFLTGTTSILLAVVNALPFYSMNQPTDGMMFFSILRKSPMAERFYNSSLLTKKLSSGIRPRDLQLEKDYEEIEDSHDMIKALYLYFQEMDQGNVESAEEYLQEVEKNLHKIPPYGLPPYYYEILYGALIKGDLEKAQRYYEKAGKILKKDQDINGLRVKAYYAYYAEKEPVKAMDLAKKGIAVMDHYPFKGQAVYEADVLKKLIREIEEERQGLS